MLQTGGPGGWRIGHLILSVCNQHARCSPKRTAHKIAGGWSLRNEFFSRLAQLVGHSGQRAGEQPTCPCNALC
jgi:hypothetical protein